MTAWRMAFRNGDTGWSFWDECKRLGVAAISYWPLGGKDLSRVSREQFRELARPLKAAQKSSLGRLRYDMKPGHIIYVKEGPRIVGTGVVKGPYRFDKRNRIHDKNGNRWTHQVPVSWDASFSPVEVKLGTEQQHTVAILDDADVQRAESAARSVRGRGSARQKPSSGRWWIYKCNNRRHPDQVAYGDWDELFEPMKVREWGSTEWVSDLKKLSTGDLVIATQTERNELVGVAVVDKIKDRRNWIHVYLRPLKTIHKKIRPLKKADSRVARIPALQPGQIKTIYEISETDAVRLLRAAGFDSAALTQRLPAAVNGDVEREFVEGERQVIEAIRHVRSAALRTEAKLRWGTKCYCCGFEFGEFYGTRANGYIQVHHCKPISSVRRSARNTVEDVQVVCANCHVVLHLNPPLEVDELRTSIARRRARRKN